MRSIVKYRQSIKTTKHAKPWKSIHRQNIVAKLLDKRYTPTEIFTYLKTYVKEVNNKKIDGYYKCTIQTIINDIHEIELTRQKWYKKNTKSYITNLSRTLSSIDALIKKAHNLDVKNIDKAAVTAKIILEQLRSIGKLEEFRAKITGLLTNKVEIKGGIGNTNLNMNMTINDISARYNNLKKYINEANLQEKKDGAIEGDTV